MKDSRDEGAMQHIFAEQKQALLHQAVPDLAQRRRLLQGCIDLLVENYGALCRAVSEDYGHRSEHLTLGEIQGALAAATMASRTSAMQEPFSNRVLSVR